jgi:hypothetical protein
LGGPASQIAQHPVQPLKIYGAEVRLLTRVAALLQAPETL